MRSCIRLRIASVGLSGNDSRILQRYGQEKCLNTQEIDSLYTERLLEGHCKLQDRYIAGRRESKNTRFAIQLANEMSVRGIHAVRFDTEDTLELML